MYRSSAVMGAGLADSRQGVAGVSAARMPVTKATVMEDLEAVEVVGVVEAAGGCIMRELLMVDISRAGIRAGDQAGDTKAVSVFINIIGLAGRDQRGGVFENPAVGVIQETLGKPRVVLLATVFALTDHHAGHNTTTESAFNPSRRVDTKLAHLVELLC